MRGFLSSLHKDAFVRGGKSFSLRNSACAPRLRKIVSCVAHLSHHSAGNMLMIAAIALVPLMVLVGSAVDVSRAYVAKTKLQSACDASSLAARRIMRNDTLTTDVIDTGKRFFNFNYPANTFGTDPFEPVVSRPASGIVRVTATTQLPTTIMRLFGYTAIPLSVDCDASLNFVNTDVVLVLDVTGSMLESVAGTPKIEALRSAVMALYDELAPVQQQLQTQGLRLRYGIVPYSSTVNVGRLLYAANADYIRSSTTYPSRVANYNLATNVANTPTSAGAWEYYNNSSGAGSATPTTFTRSTSQCSTWVQTTAPSPGGGPAPTATTQITYGGTSTASAYNATQDWGWTGAPTTTGNNRSCRRWKTVTTTTYTVRRSFSNWTYRQEAYDTSLFKQPSGTMLLATTASGTVASPGGSYNAQQLATAATGATTTSVGWNGCIEERDTTTSINGGTSMTVPATAYDLDINRIPNSDATRWRPMLPDVVYLRTAGSTSANSSAAFNSQTGWIKTMPDPTKAADPAYWACPTDARRLTEWSREDLDDYVTSLDPIGGTYHDIGMIWGARFISTGGVFADGCEEYNGMPCNRHIIFMTDGAQTAYCNVLTAYGVEQNDMRTTGAGNCPSQLARHQQRLRIVCNAAKNMNVSVWVIGFATSLNSDLTGCASNSNQASTSADGAGLISRFRQIGNQIGALRLVK